MSAEASQKAMIASSLDSFEAAGDWQADAIDAISAAIEATNSAKVRVHLALALQNAARAQAFFLMETHRK